MKNTTTSPAIDTNIQFDLQPQNVKDAVNKLVNGFNTIEARWLNMIAEACGDSFTPCMWNTHFVVNNMDLNNIQELLQEIPAVDDEWNSNERYGQYTVGNTGIIAQYVDGDLVLGIDGCGYSFFDNHWLPLYIALGYEWH